MELSGFMNLRRMIRDWRPDVVQAHGGEPLKYAVLGATRPRSQVVYRRIGSTPKEIARGPRRLVYARLMRQTARVVAVAEAVRSETLEVFRLRPGHVLTIPNAVDDRRLDATRDRAAVRRELGIPEAAEVVLSLGALTWEKDPLAHVEVAAGVLQARPQTWHLMVGDGPLRGQVEDAVRRRGMRRFMLAGMRSDVGDVLAASDVLLFASCSEGMPASVIEAGIAGVPVAGYAVAGMSEVVEPGVTGLLAQPADRKGLQSQVLALLQDPRRRGALGSAARQHCLARFSIGAVAPRYQELYRTLQVAG